MTTPLSETIVSTEEEILSHQRDRLFKRVQEVSSTLERLKEEYNSVHRQLLFLQKERILAHQASKSMVAKTTTNPLKKAGLTPEEFNKAYALLKEQSGT